MGPTSKGRGGEGGGEREGSKDEGSGRERGKGRGRRKREGREGGKGGEGIIHLLLPPKHTQLSPPMDPAAIEGLGERLNFPSRSGRGQTTKRILAHFRRKFEPFDCLTMKHLLYHYFHVVENKLVSNAEKWRLPNSAALFGRTPRICLTPALCPSRPST